MVPMGKEFDSVVLMKYDDTGQAMEMVLCRPRQAMGPARDRRRPFCPAGLKRRNCGLKSSNSLRVLTPGRAKGLIAFGSQWAGLIARRGLCCRQFEAAFSYKKNRHGRSEVSAHGHNPILNAFTVDVSTGVSYKHSNGYWPKR